MMHDKYLQAEFGGGRGVETRKTKAKIRLGITLSRPNIITLYFVTLSRCQAKPF